MGASIDRARVWLEQSRPDRAEPELRRALTETPQDGPTHALLALTLLALDRDAEAVDEARAAVAAAPDLALPHYALASTLLAANRRSEALDAVIEAIRLDPRDPDTWALEGRIHLARRDWDLALQSSLRGLEIDPGHVPSTNVRSVALVQSGRTQDAREVLDDALARSPLEASTHASVGWHALTRGDAMRAEGHFLEALRLSPGHEHARLGLIEALKAKNRFYRWMLSYFLWLGRQSSRSIWIVIGAFVVVPRGLRTIANAYPAARVWATPLLVAILLFVYATWVVEPMFNALLLLHPLGRHALTRRQRLGAAVTVGCVGSGVVAGIAGVATDARAVFALAVVLLTFVIPLNVAIEHDPGRLRRAAEIAAAFLGVIGLGGVAFLAADGGREGPILVIGAVLIGMYMLAVVAGTYYSAFRAAR